ncbi:MAG: mechanosensitive ion channel [Lentisphaeria bacterium]|nr:mechanosensitive ion channel [Lentisphaeria bacterium]
MNELWNMLVDLLTKYGILRILLAILVLFAGWIVAWILQKLTFKCMRKCRIGERLSVCIPDETAAPAARAEKIAARIVFWIVFLLAVVQAMNLLSLHEAASPIRDVLADVIGFLPNLFAAAILALVAWGVAAAVRYGALVLMHALRLDEKVEGAVDTGGRECNLSFTIATTLFWLVILAFVPAILGALRITGLARPFEAMTADVLRYLPRIFAAVLIAAAGLFLATILRKLVERLIRSSGGLGDAEEAGGKLFSRDSLARICGVLVFIFIVIPVSAAALSALGIDSLTNSVSKLFTRMLNSAGNIVAAAIVLFVAFAVGALVARLAARLLADAGLDRRVGELGWKAQGGMNPSNAAGKLLFAGILVFALVAALEILQLEETAKLVRSFLPFAGRLVLGAVIFLLGMMLANLAADFVRSNGVESHVFLFAVRIAVLFFAGVAALTTAGIGGSAALLAFGIVLGAFAAAFAIAFGLGGRNFAERKLEEWDREHSGDKKDTK